LTLPILTVIVCADAMKNIAELQPEFDDLAEPEQFCVVMSSVKRLTPRLNSILFKMKFDDLVNDIKPVCIIKPAHKICFNKNCRL